MKSKLFLMVLGLMLAMICYASAQVPQYINYQGKLTNATGAPVTGTLQMVFSIYADTITQTSIWSETNTAVVVEKGIFNVLLGSVSPISYSVFDGSTRYLGVKVGSDDEITPRKPMVSVAYAFKSFEADTADFARGFLGTIENADKVDGFHASSTPTANYLYPLDVNTKIPNAQLYTGAGNGLDADKVDGKHGTNLVRGVGTTNYIPKWVGSDTLDNSVIYQKVDSIGIGTENPTAKLHVAAGKGAAVRGISKNGPGTKYGGSFHALDYGDDNIGVYAIAGCSAMGSQPGSRSNIAIYARDASDCFMTTLPTGNWAGYFVGNVRISGDLELKGSIKFEYDDTFSISVGETKTITHNLGGDSTKYIVTMYGISSTGGVHQANYGTNCYQVLQVNKWIGCEWDQLTSTTIQVTRAANDNLTVASKQWNKVILRILKNQ